MSMIKTKIDNSTQIEKEELVKNLEELVDSFNLILYNDEVNTFDHVIHCIVKYCKYDLMEAEQCTWIVHVNGRCMLKSGEYDELELICNQMLNEGLTVKIE